MVYAARCIKNVPGVSEKRETLGSSIRVGRVQGPSGRAIRISKESSMSVFKFKVVCALVAGAFAVLPVLSHAQITSPDSWVPGRLLVKPKAGLSDAEFEKILKGHGAKSVGKISGIGVHIVQLPANASEKAIEALLTKNPHIKFAERDMLMKARGVANDPYFASAWHIPKIGADSVWDIVTGKGVTVAVLDTGVDASHPDLAGKVLAGWNFYDNTSNTADDFNHGTAVAGVIAAVTNNGVGVSSIAPGALILPIRVSDSSGYGSSSAMASGVTWAADKGVKVANISYMAGGSATVQTAGTYLRNKGGLLVVSAGNSGALASYAASDSLIAVAATDSADVRASWSSYGDYVDLAAPGVGLPTTEKGGGYASESGTSFSSPAVAAVIALTLEANPNLAPSDREKALFSTAVDLGTAGKDQYYGWGRVNALAAVNAAKAMVASDTVAPVVALSAPIAGATVSGLVPVTVTATDNVGVSRVDLSVNGAVVASETVSPYAFSWDSTSVSDGATSLVAYAYDSAGNYASTTVKVNVSNTLANSTAADTAAPSVAVVNPVGNSKVSGTVQVSVSASDNVSVTKIKLYVDGTQVATGASGSLSYSWNTKKASAGSHTIKAEALDAAGNVGTTSVTVTK